MVTAPIDTAPYSEAARRMLRPEDCALAVIDIQEKLLPPIFEKERLVRNAQLLVRLADILSLPIIVSTQYEKGLGKTVDEMFSAPDMKPWTSWSSAALAMANTALKSASWRTAPRCCCAAWNRTSA